MEAHAQATTSIYNGSDTFSSINIDLAVAKFEHECRQRRKKPAGFLIPWLRLTDLETIRNDCFDGVLPNTRIGLRMLEVTVNYLLQVNPQREDIVWRRALAIAPWGREHIVEFMGRYPVKWGAHSLGAYLEIPEWGRIGLGLQTIGSMDVTPEGRKAIQRKTNTAYQRAKRHANGATPRDESVAAKCRRLHISRTTYYKRRAHWEAVLAGRGVTDSSAVKRERDSTRDESVNPQNKRGLSRGANPKASRPSRRLHPVREAA